MTAAAEVRPAWRCEGCGRIANSRDRPRGHRRHGQPCGPFAAATVAPDGAVLVAADAVIAAPRSAAAHDAADPLRFRQSRIRSYTECARSTVLASDLTTGTIGSTADLGSAFHAVAAEILRTLRRQGERQMSTQEAIEVMREVVAAGPWVLGADDYHVAGGNDGIGLVQLVCAFADQPWPVERIMAIEQRLSMPIVCPDGEVRTLTGAPDLVIADPPTGVVLVDHKTGRAKPQTPREVVEGQAIQGAQYLSDGGYLQLVVYGALAMNEWPRIQTATLREKNWRWGGPPREATLSRADLEHVLPYLGTVMQQLDRGLREGEGSEFAQPRPGKKCLTRCPVLASCPVPAEQRGIGAIDSPAAADRAAARWIPVEALNKALRMNLKAWHEETGHCPDTGDGRVVRWDGPKGSRKFGIHKPFVPDSAAADDDFIAQWQAELEVQQAKAGAAA